MQKTFVESPMWTQMSETYLRLQQSSPQTLPENLGPALERLNERLGEVSMPVSLAHGDFAPWNTRLGARSLFVLDWERASEGMSSFTTRSTSKPYRPPCRGGAGVYAISDLL
jgi:hypothetical protein